jgi:hypothetical protein
MELPHAPEIGLKQRDSGTACNAIFSMDINRRGRVGERTGFLLNVMPKYSAENIDMNRVCLLSRQFAQQYRETLGSFGTQLKHSEIFAHRSSNFELLLNFPSAIVCHSGRDPMAIFMTETLCRNHKHNRQLRPNLLSV